MPSPFRQPCVSVCFRKHSACSCARRGRQQEHLQITTALVDQKYTGEPPPRHLRGTQARHKCPLQKQMKSK
jgi:hypothetical protein